MYRHLCGVFSDLRYVDHYSASYTPLTQLEDCLKAQAGLRAKLLGFSNSLSNIQ